MLTSDQLNSVLPSHITVEGYEFELVINSSPDPYNDPYGNSLSILLRSRETPKQIKHSFNRDHTIESVQEAIISMTRELADSITTIQFEM